VKHISAVLMCWIRGAQAVVAFEGLNNARSTHTHTHPCSEQPARATPSMQLPTGMPLPSNKSYTLNPKLQPSMQLPPSMPLRAHAM
jgi:hypothetical protein